MLLNSHRAGRVGGNPPMRYLGVDIEIVQEFASLWREYAEADDATLTEDAKALKRQLRALILQEGGEDGRGNVPE